MLVYEREGNLVSVDRIGGRTAPFADANALVGMPSFSNDGTHVAYLRAADPVAGQPESAELVVVDADGRNERQLGTFAAGRLAHVVAHRRPDRARHHH